MVAAVILAFALVLSTSLIHFVILRWLSGGMAHIAMTDRMRVLFIVFVTLAAHLVEVVLYAGAYALSDQVLRLGAFNGLPVVDAYDYLYFSIVSFTSLGLGDVFPSGHLRFITGVEALNGLLLIAWSGSFLYLAMGRLWPWQNCAAPTRFDAQQNNKRDQS